MTKENLKKLEDKIRELVPRLREPSFGCAVIWGSWRYTIVGKLGGHEAFRLTAGNQGILKDKGAYIPKEHFDKIIGHPITLEAVLEAIWITNPYLETFLSRDFANKRFVLINDDCIQGVWQLGQPWENQHEVHDFLFKLLNL